MRAPKGVQMRTLQQSRETSLETSLVSSTTGRLVQLAAAHIYGGWGFCNANEGFAGPRLGAYLLKGCSETLLGAAAACQGRATAAMRPTSTPSLMLNDIVSHFLEAGQEEWKAVDSQQRQSLLRCDWRKLRAFLSTWHVDTASGKDRLGCAHSCGSANLLALH